MDDFLIPVSTTKAKRPQAAKPLVHELHASSRTQVPAIDSPDVALRALKEEPDFETVSKVLDYLSTEADKKDGFNLISPDPGAANMAFQLVNDTIPNYWPTLKERGVRANQLARCLRNPCGIGAIITRLRPLIADCRQKKPFDTTRDALSYIEDLLEILDRVLRDDECSSEAWRDVQKHAKNPVQGKMMWKEYVTQIASGKVLSLAAEAEDALKERRSPRSAIWMASGNEYAAWLGRNIAALVRGVGKREEGAGVLMNLCGKALALGYTDQIVSALMSNLINSGSSDVFSTLLFKLKVFEQRKYLNSMITFVTKQYFGSNAEVKEDAPLKPSTTVSAAAALFHGLIKDINLLQESLVSTLTRSSIPALDGSLFARRSVIATIAQDEDQLHGLLENSLKIFGDAFYIKHAPIWQQEGLAQTIALTCGYVHRIQPMFLSVMAKSSYHTSGMSNRIGSSSARARFLGIAVGMAISKMVDKPELQLKFEMDGDEAVEAKWYQHLTKVDDKLGKIQDLVTEDRKPPEKRPTPKAGPKPPQPQSKASNKPSITEIKGPRIVEILDDSNEDDFDLMPYEQPDSDPEDDTDDPTEINRNKPVAPVYIRDLLAGLRDQENYDRHALALSTAASLIRRKANFGTEVIDHIEELATILIGLQDTYDLDGFAEHRQQALIAILLAKPAAMAQWFVRAFFSGDYSLTQRTAILTTLGLGARELAGLKDTATEDLVPPSPSFPSKQLPPHLHALYSSTSPGSDPLARITSNVSKQLLSPLAAQAADSLTGPSILKVRTFSSRMEVEARRSKPIPNALAQIVAENFFFPLTGRWWIATRSSSSSNSLYTSTHLLPAFLHTLALLLQASGPSTLSLPQMTREFWALLLSLRSHALNDTRILSALLFALLMLLETNADKERLATEQGKELIETQEWVKMVFENLPGGQEGGEEERVRVLAAGVVVRCQEVVEKYQRRLVGSLMDY
ncbi:hypothetical protein K458DRAFT_370430 [Lentithecium fluviatile CBS 122367]|uniref:Telomere length regulation protein conserved domain-containing protein n=1 Tax=Lentithecium fluviatile CBS 122367 TaxID=1168545 RepID=A0A6G1IWZ9_9PLEO|nr:hypothetical protein K458DRAFT_370430 [Lentithecium fluviatile CBS 122367]